MKNFIQPVNSCVKSVMIVIDLEHVVYCKNCKHRDPEDHRCDCGGTGRAGCMFPVDDTYFCAYGEAKDETTE